MIPVDAESSAIVGDPAMVELLAARLRRKAASLDAAAARLTTLRPVGWTGPASYALTTSTGDLGRRYAESRDRSAAAARALDRYASSLTDAQSVARRAETEPDPDIAAALRRHAGAEAMAAADTCRAALQELLPSSNARPWWSHVTHAGMGVLVGTFESSRELLNTARYMTPQLAAADPEGSLRCLGTEIEGVAAAIAHPRQAAGQMLDLPTWRTDPARAVGHLVPDLALALATGGSAAARRLAVPPSLRGGVHGLRDINRAPGPRAYDNCPSCVVALDQTLAGAPASAIRDRAMRTRDLAALYDAMFVIADRDWIREQLVAGGDGARGIVFGMRDGRDGHVFNAVNENGRVYFVDGQTGEPAVFQKSYVQLFFLRTDTATLAHPAERGVR